MDAAKASAPDKNLPHPFEAAPENLEEARTRPDEPKAVPCTLCGLPRNDRLHVEGQAQADAESPNWG
jgi:hypothetical protein